MSILIRVAKLIISLAILAAGVVILQPAHWPAAAAALSFHVPPDWYLMRLERLLIGGAVSLLGGLAAVNLLIPARK
jgi:hypothetical protein